MKNKIALTCLLFVAFTVIAFANWQGDLRRGGIDTYDGYVRMDSFGYTASAIIDYTTTGTARTVTVRESGSIFTASELSDDPVTFNLPDASKGLIYTFVDLDATAAADLVVNPKDGDKINGGTAGVSYNLTGDAVGETMTLLAVDGVNWVIIGYRGTASTGS